MADQRLLFDTFCAVTLFLVAVLGSWLPLHLKTKKESPVFQAAYHLGNCLSAGVMLSAGFCHLLADSLKSLAFVGTHKFPMATFLAAVGYLVTLGADQVVSAISESQATESDSKTADVELGGAHTRQIRASEKTPLLGQGDSPMKSNGGGSGQDEDWTVNGDSTAPMVPLSKPCPDSSTHSHSGAVHSTNGQLGNGSATAHIHGSQPGRHSQEQPRPPLRSQPSLSEEGCGHLDVLIMSKGPKLHFATAVLLAIALCVHSVLEGMALGAQETMRSSYDIMLAIAAHKGLAAYALGSSVVETGADVKRFWTVALTFSLATPVAIFIGYGLSTVSSGHGGSALSALASGTFLYVAMMEVIPRELSGAHGGVGPRWMRPAKVVSLLLGFGAMSLLALWA